MKSLGNTTISVLGCGHIGKRHAHLINNLVGAELSALIDSTDKESLKIQELDNVPFFNSFERFLEEERNTNVVSICTPSGLHTEHAMMALEAGKHIIIEKPMGLDSVECQKVIDLADSTGLKVFCVMQNRYSPPSRFLKQIIEENRLGKIFNVQVNCFWNRNENYYKQAEWRGTMEQDGGVLFTQFSHFIDTLYWLFGDIQNISTKLTNNNHPYIEFDDSGISSFEFVNGGLGSINFSTSLYKENLESSITIIGEKGTVKVGGQYMDKLEACNIENFEAPELGIANPPNDYGHYKGSAANHQYVFENVVNCLLRGDTPTVAPEDGLAVVDIIERIYSAAN